MAFGTTQFLSNLLFGVEPIVRVMFEAVAVGLLMVGLAVSYVPARRAGGIDPVIALRQS